MAISRIATTRQAATAQTSGSPTLPPGTANGDLVIMAFSVQEIDINTTLLGVIEQWTIHENVGDAATWQMVVASKRYDGAWSMPSISWGGSSDFNWWRVASYRGSQGRVLVDDTSAQHNTASASCTAPEVTATGKEDLLLMFDSPNGSCASWTPPASMAAVDDIANSVFLAEQQLSSAGVTGTRVGTNAAALANVGALVALTEAVGKRSIPSTPGVPSVPTI